MGLTVGQKSYRVRKLLKSMGFSQTTKHHGFGCSNQRASAGQEVTRFVAPIGVAQVATVLVIGVSRIKRSSIHPR